MEWRDYLGDQQEREQDANSRETSIEVMQAIVENATSEQEVEQIWENGEAIGLSHYSIIRRAKALADGTGQEYLHWGLREEIMICL